MSSSDVNPHLVPGFGFHLEGDGFWDVQEIPKNVLETAEFFGNLDIEGFQAVVFQTPSGDQWAQKAPGTPAPKGDEAKEQLMSFSFDRIATRILLSFKISSDVLDLLKDKQGLFNLPKEYQEIKEFLEEKNQKKITDEFGDEDTIMDLYDTNPDKYDEYRKLIGQNLDHETEVDKDLIDLAIKSFEKVFPGETFAPRLDPPDLRSTIHEAGHVIFDPGFDLGDMSSDLQGDHNDIGHMYDELMNNIILTDDPGQSVDGNVGLNEIFRKSIVSDRTYGEIFDYIKDNTEPTYQKYSNNLVSNLKHKFKDELDKVPEEREAINLRTYVFEYLNDKFGKDPFIPRYEDREILYKKWFNLFRKYLSNYKNKLMSSPEDTLKSVATRMAKVNLDPSLQKSLENLAIELENAENALDRAVQFGRRLEVEPSFEWIVQHVESTLNDLKEFRKGAQDAINYALPEGLE